MQETCEQIADRVDRGEEVILRGHKVIRAERRRGAIYFVLFEERMEPAPGKWWEVVR